MQTIQGYVQQMVPVGWHSGLEQICQSHYQCVQVILSLVIHLIRHPQSQEPQDEVRLDWIGNYFKAAVGHEYLMLKVSS